MKPRLLIAWGNPYIFSESIIPLFEPLARSFEMHLLLVDFFLSRKLLDDVDDAVRRGVLASYRIVPEYTETFRLHHFMWKHLEELRQIRFDAFLALSMMQVYERYLVECVLPSHAVKVCFSPSTTYLLEREESVTRLLSGCDVPDSMLQRASGHLSVRMILKQGIRLYAAKPSFRRVLSGAKHVVTALGGQLLRRWRDYADRVLLPTVVYGKTFRLRRRDWLTQIGTDQFDAVIFCDPVEARAHAALFGNPAMFVARHPAEGGCRCHRTPGPRRAVLSPLAGFVGHAVVPPGVIDGYVRDLRTAVRESGASELHLRLHPRESGSWPRQLRERLIAAGVNAHIVDSTRPLRDIVCEYLGVVGASSASLRDARAACDQAFVVGLCGASRHFFENPKFVMGAGEGLGWIEADGSYRAGIFQRTVARPRNGRTVPEILEELMSRGGRGVSPSGTGTLLAPVTAARAEEASRGRAVAQEGTRC